MSFEDEPCIAADICAVSSSGDEWRKGKLLEKLRFEDVPPAEMSELQEFLARNHTVFSLEDGERGETDLVTLSIDTGDAQPIRQPPCRMPFVIRGEVSKQLRDMQ